MLVKVTENSFSRINERTNSFEQTTGEFLPDKYFRDPRLKLQNHPMYDG